MNTFLQVAKRMLRSSSSIKDEEFILEIISATCVPGMVTTAGCQAQQMSHSLFLQDINNSASDPYVDAVLIDKDGKMKGERVCTLARRDTTAPVIPLYYLSILRKSRMVFRSGVAGGTFKSRPCLQTRS